MFKNKLDSTIELSFQNESLLESTASFNIPKRDLKELTVSVSNTDSSSTTSNWRKTWKLFCFKVLIILIIIVIAIFLLYNLISFLKIELKKDRKNINEIRTDEAARYEFDEYKNQACGQNKIKPNFGPDSLKRVISKRIIGGEDAVPNSWPWIVSVQLKRNNTRHICGGSLVRDDLVVTAAHCIMIIIRASVYFNVTNITEIFSMVQVHVGVNNHQSPNISAENVYDVKYFDLHKKYQSDLSLRNDIALIRLKRKVNLDRPEVALICLPLENSNTADVNVGDELVAVGWGTYAEEYDHAKFIYNNLQQIILTAFDSKSSECNTGIIGNNWDKLNIICVHSKEKTSTGTCFGDSGGPVTVYRNNRWILVGVISYGHYNKDESSNMKKCDGTKPSYIAKVSSYLDYIRD